MKTAYVLSGGGAKGAFQVGVMEYLDSKGVKPEKLYGTSVGALNAVGYSHQGISGLRKIWLEIKGRKSILCINYFMLFRAGIFNTRPLRKLVEKTIEPNSIAEAFVTKVNLVDGSLEFVSNKAATKQELLDSTVASASIPVIMEPVDTWVDGGVREVAPLRQAIKDGAQRVIVIMASPINDIFGKYEHKNWKFLNFIFAGYRAIDLLQSEILLNDIRRALRNNHREGKRKVEICVFAPSKALLGTLDFDPKKIRLAMEQGFKEAADNPHGLELEGGK